jgi:hypothetical protein
MSLERETPKVFFHAWLTHMHKLVTFGELSNNVDTTGTGSMRVVARRVAISYGSSALFKTQYGCQPPTRKSIQFWDNKLRTTGCLLRVKSPGRPHMSITLERHSSEVRANQFALLACSYIQIPRSTV